MYLVLWLLIIRHSTRICTCNSEDGVECIASTSKSSGNNVPDLNSETLKKLSIFAVDETNPNSTKCMDENEYDFKKIENYFDFYVYNFKPDVKCVEVKFDNNSLWKHDANQFVNVYPMRIFFHVRCMIIFINFESRYLGYSYDNESKGWVLKYDRTRGDNEPYSKLFGSIDGDAEGDQCSEPNESDGEQRIKPKEESTPIVVVLDVNHKKSCDHYEYKKGGKVHTWTANEGYEFNKVVKGTDELLKPTDSRNYVKVTLDLTDSSKPRLSYELAPIHLNFSFDDENENEESKPESGNDQEESEESGSEDPNLDVEETPEDEGNKETINSNVDEIKFGEDKTITSDGEQEIEPDTKSLRSREDQVEETLPIQLDPLSKSISQVVEPKVNKETQTLEIFDQSDSQKNSTNNYQTTAVLSPYNLNYNYFQGELVEVRYKGETVWRHIENEPYPKSTGFLAEIWLLTIKISDKQFYFYKFDGYKWYKSESSMKYIVRIEANRKSTNQYYYSGKDYIDTYLPTEKYLFSSVEMPKPSLVSCFISHPNVIWKTEVPEEYANKVIVNRHWFLNARIDVTIFMLKGCELTYTKPGLNTPFQMTGWSEPTFNLPQFLFITTAENFKGKNSKINDNSKFGIYKFVRKYSSESSAIEVYKYVIEFFKKSKCINIKYRNKTIWTNENKSKILPSKVTIDLDSCIYYIDFVEESHNVKIHDLSLSNMECG